MLPTNLLLRDRFDSLRQIGHLSCPVLIIAGDQDRIVPQHQSRRLFDAAQEPKRFVLIRGANHNDFDLLAGGQLLDEVTRFVGDGLTLSSNLDKPAANAEGTPLSVSDQVATRGASVDPSSPTKRKHPGRAIGRRTGSRNTTTRSAVEELPNLLSWGDHHLGGTVIMATATSTGYCMKCKAQREIKNAKQITMKNGRPATEGTCPVCSTKIFKIGAIK